MRINIEGADEVMIIEDDLAVGDLVLFTSVVLVKRVEDDSADVDVIVNNMSVIATSKVFEEAKVDHQS